METLDFINAHERIALQFSGGRDSLAMLLSLRPHWDKFTVYWCNAGDAYPETLELIARIRSLVPHFVEISGHVAQVHAALGWPSDVMHAGASWMFGPTDIKNHVKLVDPNVCCFKSMMEPMHLRMMEDGITLILRGQRDSDEPKSHVRNGQTINGVTIAYPIASWTTAQVDEFIAAEGWELPRFYQEGTTSMPDCMHCTAWLEHGATTYLAKHHPQVAAEVGRRLKTIQITAEPFIERLNKAQENINGMV